MSNFKVPILRDPKWMKTVKSLPCVLTGYEGGCDPAHIRHGLGGGTSLKPPDDLVLPLRPALHRRQHAIGEVRFWQEIMSKHPHFMMACLKAYARALYKEHHP